MAFDYKKEYKELYLPKVEPSIIKVPQMNFLAIRGKGNPNEQDSEYSKAISLLYGVSYTIKMSYKGEKKIVGYFEYVVPPLEGLWWQEGIKGMDYSKKAELQWVALIRLPEFVTKEVFDWAIITAAKKKKQDFSKVEFFTYDEGLCVQCLHQGAYDDEPATIKLMDEFAINNGYDVVINEEKHHHEIYLSNLSKVIPEKLKTVIRHPIKKRGR